MSESREIRALRMMAWRRAKGEIESMFDTYWDNAEKYAEILQLYEEFVAAVEDEGLHE